MFECILFAAALVVNGGFEQDGDSWRLGRNTCRIVPGVGLNASKALVWKNDNPEFYSFTTQKLPLEPGVAYSFGGWVKDCGTSNAKRKGTLTNISVEWRNAAGKFIAMAGSFKVEDNQEREEGWVRFKGATPVMPADLGEASLVCSVLRGSIGEVVFDEIEVSAVVARPISSLVSSAYRDTAADGKVKFVAKCILNPHRDPVGSVSAKFSFVGVQDGIEVPAKISSEGLVAAELDVCRLAKGTHPVQIELKRRDGSVLAVREMEFTRADSLPVRKVFIDGHGRTIVDGKPFFPLGMYSSRREVKDLDIYRQGPFNCILPYALPANREALDPYHEKGLKVIVCVSDFTGFRGSKLKTRFDERSYAMRYLEAMKDHPAILAWYLADELPPAKIDDLRERNLLFRKHDPDHPTYVVFDNPDRPADFVEGYDVIGMDPYPIGNVGSRCSHIDTASTFPEAAKRGMYGFKAMWQVPQAFDWSWHRPWAKKDSGAHMPTLAELRNMNWQAVASGANGLVGWWFSGMVRNYKDVGKTAEFDEAWGNVKTAYAEVAQKVPILLSVEKAAKVTKKPANISARTWSKDGVLWLLAVNRTYSPVAGEIELSDGRKTSVRLDSLGYGFFEVK